MGHGFRSVRLFFTTSKELHHGNGCAKLAHTHLGVGPGAVGAADFDVVAAGSQGGHGEEQLPLGAGGKVGGGHLHGAAGAGDEVDAVGGLGGVELELFAGYLADAAGVAVALTPPVVLLMKAVGTGAASARRIFCGRAVSSFSRRRGPA